MAKTLPTIWGAAVAVAAFCGTAAVAAQPAQPRSGNAAKDAAKEKEAAAAKEKEAAAAKEKEAAAAKEKEAKEEEVVALTQKVNKGSEEVKLRALTGDAPGAQDGLEVLKKDANTLEDKRKDPQLSDPTKKAAADAVQKGKEETPKVVEKTTDSLCGAGKDRPRFCFYVGVFVASGSLTGFSVGALHGGKTGHALVSTAIPAAGVRMPIDREGRFSIELGLMSMLLSKDLTATAQRNGCRLANNDFERRLPCEGNVSISPVVGTYFGLTAGTKDIGLLTLMPMVGGATTSLDGSIRPYYGIAVGLVNLSKTFNIGSSSPKPE